MPPIDECELNTACMHQHTSVDRIVDWYVFIFAFDVTLTTPPAATPTAGNGDNGVIGVTTSRRVTSTFTPDDARADEHCGTNVDGHVQ